MNKNGEIVPLLTFTKSKLLIGILACHHRAPHLQAIRETWVPDIKGRCEYRFFFGRGSHGDVKQDEVVLGTDDAYRGLAHKVQEACRWAFDKGYDAFFKIDDDGYVRPDRLWFAVNGVWAAHDWVGVKLGATDQYHTNEYARGGPGYYLSRRAMQILASAPTPNPNIPSEYAEDSFVGKILTSAGLRVVHDDRLRCADLSGPGRKPRPAGFEAWKRDAPSQGNAFITTCEFLGSEMYPVHQHWLDSRQQHTNLMNKLRIK